MARDRGSGPGIITVLSALITIIIGIGIGIGTGTGTGVMNSSHSDLTGIPEHIGAAIDATEQ